MWTSFFFVTTALASAAAALLAYFLYDLYVRHSKIQQAHTETSRKLQEYTEYALRLKATNERLAKYQKIVNAEAEAARIIGNASAEARAMIAKAEASASGICKSAEDTRAQAEIALREASTEAATITGEARRNADLYTKAAEAMRNIVDGYGDQYIIPTHSLLDDLAADFGFAEAGARLKEARTKTRRMVFSGEAATCEYSDKNRQATALNFVIDAFNGKVDSILSRVKSDNAGTLSQEIRDAFALVNVNGKAFRDARISDEYLVARLDELKWAAIVQKMKLDAREEQRLIKEQAREEEKARRDFERAQREAAKEEELLRKAMAKLQGQFAQATEEQRTKYEAQFKEMQTKLQQVEDEKQRASSMAQFTRKGHVYIISNIGSFGENVYKIGMTRRYDPLERVYELGDSSVPFAFDVHALIMAEDAPALERALHKRFVLAQVNKVNYRKEFFRVGLREIREEVEKMGLSASWTMTALAQEYKESLAIEKRLREDPGEMEAWTKQQIALDLELPQVGRAAKVAEDEEDS